MSLELRPPRLADAAAIAEMMTRWSEATGKDAATASEIESWFGIPSLDLQRDARVAVAGGAILGYADVGDGGGDGRVLYLDVRVDPGCAGVARALLDFAEQRALELAASDSVVKIGPPEGAASLRGLVEDRGYSFDRYSFRMLRELDEQPPPPEWPDGISVRTFDRDFDTEAVYEAHQEAFSEERDFTRDPFDDWVYWSFREPFDPALWFLAEGGSELAGIALCRPERDGDFDVGWINILGVRKPWRGRGLGKALLLHAFQGLRAAGKRQVGLGVNGDNPEALRLYEGAGMRRASTTVWYARKMRKN